MNAETFEKSLRARVRDRREKTGLPADIVATVLEEVADAAHEAREAMRKQIEEENS